MTDRRITTDLRAGSASFLDHLPSLLVIIAPLALLTGWLSWGLRPGPGDVQPWLLGRLGVDALTGPVWMLLGLHISQRDLDWQPAGPLALLKTGGPRLPRGALLYLSVALLLHPAMLFFFIPALGLGLGMVTLLQPVAWLEHTGPLRARPQLRTSQKLVGAIPLLLLSTAAIFLLSMWDLWSSRIGLGMWMIDAVCRGLIGVWGWSMLYRLLRDRE